jgi:hypothetical protein
MRGPDPGSDYRRRLLLETMRGHTLTGHGIKRRLRTRPGITPVRLAAGHDDGAADRPQRAQHQRAGE